MQTSLYVYLLDGSACTPKFKGSVALFPNITLHYVYLIPQFGVNLLFVSCLTQSSNLVFVFLPYKCLLQDRGTNQIIREAHQQGNLYQLSTPLISHLNTVFAKVWHQRLGHASTPVSSHLDIQLQDTHKPCDPCHFAKQYRLPFPKIPISTSSLFQLLHVDLWEPYKTPSLNGAHYFVTIVDDYSRVTWTILIPDKTHVFVALRNFITMIQKQFDVNVKILRTDNGNEFVNNQCTKFFESMGIIHQTTCPYTPQQNGRVEIKHNHLLQITRALMFQAALPHSFWGEALLHATYITNKLPTSVLGWVSPHEKLYKTKSDLSVPSLLYCS